MISLFRKLVNTLLLLWVTSMLTTPVAWGMGEDEENPEVTLGGNKNNCDNCISELQGKVVYERPEGIYWHRLGADRSTLLHRDGHWPRWSPDGKSVGFVSGNRIVLKHIDSGKTRLLATADDPRAITFFATGRQVAYTDGDRVMAVDIGNSEVSTLTKGRRFLEIDMSDDGRRLAATVKRFGYTVWLFDLANDQERKIASGCSASLSPDGKLITNLVDGHERLLLRDTTTGAERGKVSAPPGLKFDNQNWSNHPDWLVSISEGKIMRVYAHHVPTDRAFPIGVDSDSDRPDLYVEPDPDRSR